ncbi:ribonuclease PH [Candidatus Sumerlaeota bacterium]|nr:ribonuclease PH [Candidatus Sumerlaeota bacterium]
MRVDGRAADALRPVRITPHFLKNAEGSALIELGDTKVVCAATLEQRVPSHAKEANTGWLTAEYDMLPRSAQQRIPRDRNRGHINGRASEIQRLIGRSLRSIVRLDKLVDRTLILDCDVMQADGGTRSAAITGSYVALALALKQLEKDGKVTKEILLDSVASVSVGIVEGRPALDLCYLEDAQADVDMNVVMSGDGKFIEIQGTAESAPFDDAELEAMLSLARKGIAQLREAQLAVIEAAS